MSDLTLTHQPVEVRELNGGKQAVFRFPNGFGASVVQHWGSYGGPQGLWELAIIAWDGSDFDLTYDTEVGNDVIGWLSAVDVDEYLLRIASLDANGKEQRAVTA